MLQTHAAVCVMHCQCWRDFIMTDLPCKVICKYMSTRPQTLRMSSFCNVLSCFCAIFTVTDKKIKTSEQNKPEILENTIFQLWPDGKCTCFNTLKYLQTTFTYLGNTFILKVHLCLAWELNSWLWIWFHLHTNTNINLINLTLTLT